MVCAMHGVDAVLVRYDLPELSPDLIVALTGLVMDELEYGIQAKDVKREIGPGTRRSQAARHETLRLFSASFAQASHVKVETHLGLVLGLEHDLDGDALLPLPLLLLLLPFFSSSPSLSLSPSLPWASPTHSARQVLRRPLALRMWGPWSLLSLGEFGWDTY